MLSRRELPGDDAKGKEIGAAVDLTSTYLFGGHVPGRARRRARLGQPRHRRNVGVFDAREAEVEDLDVAVGAADQVLRLEIPVDDVARVGR